MIGAALMLSLGSMLDQCQLKQLDQAHTQPPAGSMALVASPNDPLMIEAIRYARESTKQAAGSNAWSLPKSDGPTATFATPDSNITLSQKEIAEANFIYPQLRERAKDRAHNSAARPDDAGYATGEDGE